MKVRPRILIAIGLSVFSLTLSASSLFKNATQINPDGSQIFPAKITKSLRGELSFPRRDGSRMYLLDLAEGATDYALRLKTLAHGVTNSPAGLFWVVDPEGETASLGKFLGDVVVEVAADGVIGRASARFAFFRWNPLAEGDALATAYEQRWVDLKELLKIEKSLATVLNEPEAAMIDVLGRRIAVKIGRGERATGLVSLQYRHPHGRDNGTINFPTGALKVVTGKAGTRDIGRSYTAENLWNFLRREISAGPTTATSNVTSLLNDFAASRVNLAPEARAYEVSLRQEREGKGFSPIQRGLAFPTEGANHEVLPLGIFGEADVTAFTVDTAHLANAFQQMGDLGDPRTARENWRLRARVTVSDQKLQLRTAGKFAGVLVTRNAKRSPPIAALMEIDELEGVIGRQSDALPYRRTQRNTVTTLWHMEPYRGALSPSRVLMQLEIEALPFFAAGYRRVETPTAEEVAKWGLKAGDLVAQLLPMGVWQQSARNSEPTVTEAFEVPLSMLIFPASAGDVAVLDGLTFESPTSIGGRPLSRLLDFLSVGEIQFAANQDEGIRAKLVGQAFKTAAEEKAKRLAEATAEVARLAKEAENAKNCAIGVETKGRELVGAGA